MKQHRHSWRQAGFSPWEKDHYFPTFDCLIIGSGIVGLSAAIELKKTTPALKVGVIERGLIPIGASTRNAGFACIGSPTEILDDIATHGEAYCLEILRMRWHGLQLLRSRVGDRALQFQPTGGYEIFFPEDEETFHQVRESIPQLNAIVKDATGLDKVFKVADAMTSRYELHQVSHIVSSKTEGQLHPGSMTGALERMAVAEGIIKYSGVEFDSYEKAGELIRLNTRPEFPFITKRLLFATNGFSADLLKDIDVHPARNSVLMTTEIPGLVLRGCFHYDRGYIYFRNVGNRILLGGARNLRPEEESTDDFGINAGIRKYLDSFLREKLYPNLNFEIESEWSGILGVGAQKGPIVSEHEPGIFVAVRMGGMGIAIGSETGRRAATLVLHSL